MQELDPRIIKINIEVNGQVRTYQDLEILASGTKYANPLQNECELKITNLNRETRDFILTETTPFNKNKTPKRFSIDAGRLSYGTTRIYEGDIVAVNPSQPPDISLTIKSLTSNFQKGNIVSRNQPGIAQLSQIAKNTAQDLGLTLDFQATDQQVSNYNFSGGALKQVNKISDIGKVSAYVDNGALIVKDVKLPLNNRLTIVNLDTGMIGIPELTEQGVKVKILLDGQTTLGGALQITSVMYPTINGTYVIYKLGFEIASRDTPFYWIPEATRF